MQDDVFYRFMSNQDNWRKSVSSPSALVKIRLRSGAKKARSVVVDDTDYPKTGRRMENIDGVSHVHHRCILGFGILAVSGRDNPNASGFCTVGEKGKDGKLGFR